jgi:hypothetical protein
MNEGGTTMTEGPITQANAVVFLRARVLDADGRNHASEMRHVESQRELCQAAAVQLDAVIVREYVEYGGTGPISARPILRQMLDDLATLLGIRYVLAANIDRLARMPADLTAIQEAIQANGAYVLNVDQLPTTYRCGPNEIREGIPTNYPTKGGSW